MGPERSTDAEQVKQLFGRSLRARRALEGWERARIRAGVQEVAYAHVTRAAYRVTTDQVERLRDEIRRDSLERFPRGAPPTGEQWNALHPLGRLDQREIARHAADWSPPMSFTLAFHTVLERHGGLFVYPYFAQQLKDDPTVLGPLMNDSARELVRHSQVGELAMRRSIRWRLGCAYYSFLKELYVLAWMGEHDVRLSCHPLADALFRTDFWTPDLTAVAILVDNDRYARMDGTAGRKPPMDDFLGSVFHRSVRHRLHTPKRFGTVDLPDERSLFALRDEILATPSTF